MTLQRFFPPGIAYRNIIFIPLFFAFFIVLKIFGASAFVIDSFSGRPVSAATAEGINVAARVIAFYRAIGFATLLIIFFTRLMVMILDYFQEEELLIVNGLSLAGFCLLYFELLGADMKPTLNIIFAFLLISTAGFVSHQVKKRYDRDFLTIFIWTVLVSISIFFLQLQVSNLLLGKNLLSLPEVLVIAGIPLYLLYTNRFRLSQTTLRTTKPLILLPFISFGATELSMILNQHGVFVSPGIFYFTAIILVGATIFYRLRNSHDENHPRSLREQLFGRWIPWLIGGMTCLAFYKPIVQPEIDWFEDANHVLPLHQWFSFGKLPFFDSFSSHAFSDFFFGLLYSVFNGKDPMGGFVYGFMLGVIVVLVIYFFIYRITGNGLLATWTALAYPYASLLIPSYFNVVPLVAIAFINLYEKQSARNYFLFFFSIFFMMLWRIDLGSSTLIAGLICFVMLRFFTPGFSKENKTLFRGLGITLLIAAPVVLLGFIHSGTHLFTALKDALAYMSSAQSYGVKDLAPAHDLSYYSLYFIMPAAVLLIVIHNIYNVCVRRDLENKTAFRLAVIFLGVFYFANLQRGLLRHTLFEQWDTALTSFGYLIVVSPILIKFLNRNPFVQFFVFFMTPTILISNYVYPSINLATGNFYGHIYAGMSSPLQRFTEKSRVDRIVENPTYEKGYVQFSAWLKKNFSPESTFLDFSNSPMLYYFTDRVVPNYFDQIPHTAHDEYLQKRFIEDLKNYDLPVVVFSNVPPGYWDNLDGIPNTLRHYRIAEYIYGNYYPGFILNGHSVWLRNNLNQADLHTDGFVSDTTSLALPQYSLKWIPYMWGTYDENFTTGKIASEVRLISSEVTVKAKTSISIPFMLSTNKKNGNYIKITARTDVRKETFVILSYASAEGKSGAFMFSLKGDAAYHDYLIRISSQYNWFHRNNTSISINADNDIVVRSAEILKGD